jgi:phosphatidylserine decarboxylase
MSDEIQQIILDEVRNIRGELQLHRTESAERHDNLDVRVRATEKWVNNADGKITVLGVVAVMVGSVLTWLANRLFTGN